MQKNFDDKNVITTSKTGITEIGMAETDTVETETVETETVETETVETETTVSKKIYVEEDEDTIRQEKVSIAISIGEELIKNGGEVSRVEDTLERLLEFYQFGRPNVFVVSNGIFLTVDEGTKNTITCVRTIPYWSTNLEKISLLNALSRQICQGKCSVREAKERIEEIKNLKQNSDKKMIVATAFGVASFCFIFGGRIGEMLIAFLVGFVLKMFLCTANKKGVSKFMSSLIGSMVVSIVTVLCYQIWHSLLIDKIIIASIIPLVPGVALTTSIRDFFGGDYLSGGIHLIEALLTAVCIAAGVGVAMKAFAMLSLI